VDRPPDRPPDRAGDPLVGRTLDRRYALNRRIARGGMATVYEARDLRLDRICAVKVMHTDLGDDEDFGARFVREAHASARLSHPHVVSVTDQGDDDGLLFLVMEYVPGRTLRDVIRDLAPLAPQRALALLDPVLQALAAAHSSGLVHRDVKPENVLIGDDGRVKVADFGLARAFDSETQHTTTGSILIGTVSYLAPELIVNQRADPRSDVYSAGVVLFELLTGQKPHQGEGPIQIAFKHVNEDVPAPSRALGRELPAYVDALVARATARDRERRPADAKVLLHQLRRVRAALEAGEVDDPELTADLLPTMRVPIADSIDYVDEPRPEPTHEPEDATTIFDSRRGTRLDVRAGATQVDAPPAAVRAAVPAPPWQGRRPPEQRRPPGSPGATAATGSRARRRRRRGPLLLLLVVALVALTAYAGWWLGMGRYTSTPGVINLGVRAAEARLADAGLDLEVSGRQFSETVTAGSVIATEPGPGERVVEGETVQATVSRGAERFPVPALRGKDVSEVEQLLVDANLQPGTPVLVWHETVPEGEVISTSPPRGTELRRGTEVVVTLSKGPEPIRVPDLTGRDGERAADRLAELGFEVEVSERHSDTVPEREVVRQSPERGTGKRGDTVRLVVSLGPELVEVPDLLAMSVDDATLTLEDAGFEVEVEETDLYVGLDHVVGQDPSPGEALPKGSVVTISVV